MSYLAIGLFVGAPGTAHASTPPRVCADLFRARPTAVHAKLAGPLQEIFLKGFDKDFSVDMEARVETAAIESSRGEETAAYFEALMRRGLRIEGTESDLTFRGPFDLILSALRHTSILRVTSIADVPPATESTGVRRLFETESFYRRMRRLLVGRPDAVFKAELALADVDPLLAMDSELAFDARSLGLQVHSDSVVPGGWAWVTLTGSVDAVLSTLRHRQVHHLISFDRVFRPNESEREKEYHRIENEYFQKELDFAFRTRHAVVFQGDAVVGRHRPIMAYRDQKTPALVRINREVDKTLGAELQTARDYAIYLDAKKAEDPRLNRSFFYASEFEHKSIPIFDGVVISGEAHDVVANVSLKCAFPSKNGVSYADLASLTRRLDALFSDHRSKLRHYLTPTDWFRVTNRIASIQKNPRAYAKYERWLAHAALLSDLFGMFHGSRIDSTRRETQIVLDLRNVKYDFDLLNQPTAHAHLQRLVNNAEIPHLRLVLLWDAQRVIEIAVP